MKKVLGTQVHTDYLPVIYWKHNFSLQPLLPKVCPTSCKLEKYISMSILNILETTSLTAMWIYVLCIHSREIRKSITKRIVPYHHQFSMLGDFRSIEIPCNKCDMKWRASCAQCFNLILHINCLTECYEKPVHPRDCVFFASVAEMKHVVLRCKPWCYRDGWNTGIEEAMHQY